MSSRTGPLLTPEISALIGTELEVVTSLPIPESDVRYYCEIVEEKSPLYHDDEYARGLGYRGRTTPPFFHMVPFGHLPGDFAPADQGSDVGVIQEMRTKLNCGAAMDTGYRAFFLAPVYPGDVLTRRTTIMDIEEKRMSLGQALLCTLEDIYMNQVGKAVCKVHNKLFFY